MSKATSLFINGYLGHTKDYISQITLIDSGRLITTYVNADSDIKSGVDVSVMIDPTKWFNVSVSANTYYVRTVGEFNGTDPSDEFRSQTQDDERSYDSFRALDRRVQHGKMGSVLTQQHI